MNNVTSYCFIYYSVPFVYLSKFIYSRQLHLDKSISNNLRSPITYNKVLLKIEMTVKQINIWNKHLVINVLDGINANIKVRTVNSYTLVQGVYAPCNAQMVQDVS